MRQIAVQIALSFLGLTLLTIGIGGVAAVLLGDLGGTTTQTLDENVQSMVAAERMGRAFDAASAARPGGSGAADQAFGDALAQAREAAVLPEEPALLDALEAAYRTPGDAEMFGRLQARLLEVNVRAAAERAERAEAAGRDARRLLLFAVACAAIASVVAGVALARRIARPLRTLTDQVAGVGPGHLDVRADEAAGGEVGALAQAFNEMAGRLAAYESLNLRALVREKRTAESLVASIPSPVVVTEGAEARVRLVNAAAQVLVGDGALGRPLAEVAPALAAARPAPPDPLVELGQQTYRLRRTEVAVPAEPGETPGGAPDRLAILVLDDVTPFQALDAARRDFLAAVSHELRTPLTSLHLAADLLLRGAAGPLSDEQRELAEIVRGDTDRMRDLTARLLDLARVEVGGRPVGPVDLAEVARVAAESVRLAAAERGLAVTVEADGALVVPGDADGLAMAASNLVANAVRHAVGRVAIRVEAGDARVRLSVVDDGPGLPAGAEDRVFDPLVQLSTGAASGSAGLGLSIVRRVADAHGGRTWAEPGPGGRFFLSLPASPEPVPDA